MPYLTVRAGSKIVAQPYSTNVYVGSNVTMAVSVIGTPPIQYQMAIQWVDIVGATSAAFTINGVKMSDEGTYQVTVSDR